MQSNMYTQCIHTAHDGSVDAVSVSEDGLRILVGTSSVSSFGQPNIIVCVMCCTLFT